MLKQVLRRLLLRSNAFRRALAEHRKRRREELRRAVWAEYFASGGTIRRVPKRM
jgi:hypothetical protein